MTRALTIAYLTGAYARASDSFVRAEVAALRRLGHRVETFSIRRPHESEVVSEDIRAERASTHYVLAAGPRALLASAARALLRRPAALAKALWLTLRCSTPGVRGRLWALAYLVEATYLVEQLEELGADHLHDHIAEGSATVAMLASALGGIPFSVAVHGPGEFDRAPVLALDEKLARSAFFAAISPFARAQVLRWTRPEDWDKVHVVRCGVEPRFLECPPQPVPDVPRLVSIGRLDAQKGQLMLLEAFARSERGELVLVGDGPLRAELERAATALGVAGRVTFTGWLPPAEVADAIVESRALALSSLAEGLPIVVMEALALGRPVIATDVGAVSELVRPGETGWLVPPGAHDALADALAEVLAAAPAELSEMGRAGASLVAERHDSEREAGKLAALIERASS